MICCIFPGQGSQYVEMGKAFYEQYPEARRVFEEAEDISSIALYKAICSEQELAKTKVVQPAICTVSAAILAVLRAQGLHIGCCAGLSLGEYTALYSAEVFSFETLIRLVSRRGALMHDACETTKGGLIAVLGISDEQARQFVHDINAPNDIWCANFNCPGQVVLAGTELGLHIIETQIKEYGARKSVRLPVHGAFHSGLMRSANEAFQSELDRTFQAPICPIAMNSSGQCVQDIDSIQSLLRKQMVSSVLWHQCITSCAQKKPTCFIEIGCGSTLTNFNKRIGIDVPSFAIERPEDLTLIHPFV